MADGKMRTRRSHAVLDATGAVVGPLTVALGIYELPSRGAHAVFLIALGSIVAVITLVSIVRSRRRTRT